MADTALGNLSVVDLTYGVAGPMCTKLFADLGAEVIKIEDPAGGDESRRTGPFFKDDPHPEKSLLYLYLNSNKMGITLDIRSQGGRRILRDLVRDTDALVENYPPGYLDSLGLGYQEMERVNPRLVMTSITPFGQTGPYRDFQGNDLICHAMSGLQYVSGAYGRAPLTCGHPQSLYMAGLTAAYTTLAAIFAGFSGNEGQHVDVSIMEVVASHYIGNITRYTYTGSIERRAPKEEGSSFKGVGFEGIVPVQDGYISPTVQRGRQRGSFTEYTRFIGAPEIDDPKFASPELRVLNARELDEAVLPALRKWKKMDYFHAAAEDGWIVGVVQTSEDLANCPQLNARGYFVEVEHPVIGRIKFPGDYFGFSQTPWSMRHPAPLLGQHNEAVYCGKLGYTREDLVRLREEGVI